MKKSVYCALALLSMSVCVFCISCNESNAPKGESNQPGSSSQDQEPSSTSVTITETVSGSQSEWETSFKKGNECVDKGNIRMATFYYVNALGKDPGNMTVIQKYREVIQNAIKKSANIEEKFGYYTALESFLQNQISTVPVDKVEQVSQWLEALAAERDKLENDAVADSGAAEEADDVADDSSDTFDELKNALEKLEANVRQSLETGLSNPVYLDIASYQLQECEQIMRSIIAMAPQLDQTRQESVAACYAGLQKLSEDVVNQKSKVLWDAFYMQHEAFVKEYEKLVKEYENLENKTIEPSDGLGNIEKRLKLIQKEMAKLQALLPKLSEKYVGDMSIDYAKGNYTIQNASAIIQKLQLWQSQSAEKQLQAYNKWAVEKIKEANNSAYDGQGRLYNDTVKIGESLIENLGPIDTRFLTSEVNRCYQEVLNKYLTSNQLNAVSDKSSWETKGNMGYTMIQMYEKPKVKLSQF